MFVTSKIFKKKRFITHLALMHLRKVSSRPKTIKYVSERLGHKSTHVTADTYLHITEKLERESLNLYFNYINS